MARKILVVDDEPDMELLIRQKFRKQINAGNFIFHFASNGAHALEILKQEAEIELVLTDINMPVMTGLTLLEKMVEEGLHCKAIVISAYTDIQNIRTAMNRGAFDFVTKPIDFNDLDTTISKTLSAIDESVMAREALVERDKALKEKQQALASEQFKQQFLANMSHEIRTPMNSVIGITHLLLRSELSEQQHRYISMIQSASEQLMSIINDILDISKIEAGKMIFEKIGFNVFNVITNVQHMLSLKAQEKGLDLKIKVANDVPHQLIGDPSRLSQILINLAGNSIKFTDKGFVEISAALKSFSNGLYDIEFSVTDTGIGIAKDKLNSIFESFTQAENETSRKYGGTGLGLTICKQLTELQGGSIGLESKLGNGTRFYFNIPYEADKNQSTIKDKVVEDHSHLEALHNIRILMVEDNEFNKIVAEDTIHEYLNGVQIDHASNGIEALQQMESGTYSMVLMDIQMPEMDGYEATRRIRLLGDDKKNTPVMAMTANATPEEISKCYESGVNDYISKPFIPDELFKKMANLMVPKK